MSQTSPASGALQAAIRSGALAALGTWTVVVLPALVGWLAAPESSLGWFSAVQVASAVWFLGQGQSIGNGDVVVSMTPLLLLLVFVYVTVRWARRLIETQRAEVSRLEWGHVARVGVVPGFLIGHLIVAAVISLLTLGGPVAPGVAAVAGSLLVPVAALGFLLLRPDEADAPGFVRTWFRRGPSWLPSAWRIGWRGAALLLGVGFGLVVLRLLLSLGALARIQGQYGLNLAAGAVVVLAQVLVLGNAATWALAFLAGPGFHVAVGATISPAAAHPGLMPLVPVLGALPDEAAYPRAMYAVVLVPVAAGVVIGRWVGGELEFFGNGRARAAAAATAGSIAVLAVGILTALGTGAVGVERLADIGPDWVPFVGGLLVEVLLGCLLWAASCWWRDRAKGADSVGVWESVDPAERRDAADGLTLTPEGAARSLQDEA